MDQGCSLVGIGPLVVSSIFVYFPHPPPVLAESACIFCRYWVVVSVCVFFFFFCIFWIFSQSTFDSCFKSGFSWFSGWSFFVSSHIWPTGSGFYLRAVVFTFGHVWTSLVFVLAFWSSIIPSMTYIQQWSSLFQIYIYLLESTRFLHIM
jgi:hypothetical protein